MANPSLDIKLGAPDIQAFKAKMTEAGNHVGTVSRHIAQQMGSASQSIEKWGPVALKAGQVAASGMLLFSQAALLALANWKKLTLIIGTFKLISDAIGEARDQLKDMVDLQNKAQDLGVSSSFLQRTRAEAKKLQVGVEDLDGALTHAFNATKDRSPVDLAKWDTGKDRITEVERALRIYNETLAKASGQQLNGLVLFRDAKTQEDKIQAVLKAMIQLEQIGQKAAALDLGEKMFGTAFVDRIRQGRTSAESLLNTIQKASGDADGIFPDVLVRRAKDMDDQLKVAHDRLSTALKPSWDDLAGVLLTIKGYWADTVNLIAKAVELSNNIKIPGYASDTDLDAKRSALDTVNRRLNGTSGWTETWGILSSRKTMEEHRDRLQAEIAGLAKGEQYGPNLPSQSRGTGERPTLKPTDNSTVDRLGTAADAIQKRAAALTAEAAALDKTTEARERAKVVAQLETLAMQINAAAGKGSNVVTEEQRRKINEVADAYSNAAAAMDKARVASSISFDRQTALLDPQDVAIAQQLKGLYPDVATALNSVEAQAMRANEAMRSIGNTMSSTLTTGLTDILDGTKSVSQGFADMGKTILRALEEAMIKMLIVAPIMRSLGGMLGFSAGGVVSAAASSPFPGYAGGGPISGPGSGRSDSILARVSNGEFVVNAESTRRFLPLLHAVNDNKVPRFADGGLVSAFRADGSSPIAANSNSVVNVAPNINIKVEGGSRGPQADEALAKSIGKQVEGSLREIVGKEIRAQLRPGGMLKGR